MERERTLHTLNYIVVPKRDKVTKWDIKYRVARNGKHETKRTVAINRQISDEKSAIPTLPNIKEYIRRLILYEYVSLRDLWNAFRQLLMSKPDVGIIQYCFFGMTWLDGRQAYGCKSSAANCQHFAEVYPT